MVEDWISQANARQRTGRAGRVKPGICFSLYTRYRFEKLMRPYQVFSIDPFLVTCSLGFSHLTHLFHTFFKVPEMLRMPLVELCLQIKLLGLGHIKPFLSKASDTIFTEKTNNIIIHLILIYTLSLGFGTSEWRCYDLCDFIVTRGNM